MARQSQNPSSKPARHLDMIRCDNCGEDYSVTYKRCPFCHERPNGMFAGRRVDSRVSHNPLQVVELVASIAVIIAALFIVFTKISPLLFQQEGGKTPDPTPPTQQIEPLPSVDPEGGSTQGTEEPSVQQPEGTGSATVIRAVSLSRKDFTLLPGEIYSLSVSVTPADADVPVVWTSSDPDILVVDAEGTVTNKNTTGKLTPVTVTATCGGMSAECIVYCRSEEVPGVASEPSGGNETSGSNTGGNSSGSTSGTKVKREAEVFNAGSGLNIRSGPGSNYDKIASAANGANVTVLEDCGGGWYKIDYGNGKIGYASSSFIKLK